MKLFWKIQITVLLSFLVVAMGTTCLITINRMADAELNVVKDGKILGDFVAHEVEADARESRWPGDTLQRLAQSKSFLFWMLVRSDGVIQYADNTDSVGQKTLALLPHTAKLLPGKTVSLNREANYGVNISPIKIGSEGWTFWFGFSLGEISRVKKEILLFNLSFSLGVFCFLAAFLYLLIGHFTKPIQELIAGAEAVGKGDLSKRVEIGARDELGHLALAFNAMTQQLEKTTVSKDYVDNILEIMPDSLLVLDQKGRILTVNRAACELLGFEKDELEGTFADVLFGDEHRWRLDLQDILDRGEVRDRETCYRLRDGGIVPALFSGSVKRHPDNTVDYIVCTAKDIARVAELQAELKSRVRDLEASLAHIRTLQGILPICSYCKKIRDDQSYWTQVESYISMHTAVQFSHGVCPECWSRYVQPQLDDLDGDEEKRPGEERSCLNSPGEPGL